MIGIAIDFAGGVRRHGQIAGRHGQAAIGIADRVVAGIERAARGARGADRIGRAAVDARAGRGTAAAQGHAAYGFAVLQARAGERLVIEVMGFAIDFGGVARCDCKIGFANAQHSVCIANVIALLA
ncbi:hypothetical protein D3C79_792120 [compost metagenome]